MQLGTCRSQSEQLLLICRISPEDQMLFDCLKENNPLSEQGHVAVVKPSALLGKFKNQERNKIRISRKDKNQERAEAAGKASRSELRVDDDGAPFALGSGERVWFEGDRELKQEPE
ncbi:hypothetical protein E5288_WYG013066 [Bos mutus]|uniref:Uncharacterized protein n=1 Tax=Bos mutus TaxID=72004 RepID=A0A6B0REY9_9CETA|nr:hypothetical protein [Bos mutus]